ncbi:hypothetical protein [Nannocystis sp. SCPEA4]|uniref:hypothetical protein n=1 Tax=Nannocystis sp. SCPEA4 TaxID=2996787 RepID=UPI00226D5C63|nr:hypothetical protein [Nannocystis sp. SCPEA4]MCY1057939.1 hypothetical protein [Nannocystis sp. SCPEA4]
MITSAMLALWFVQAPPLPMTAPPREWDLAGVFVLKQEKFLTWAPSIDLSRPFRGWEYELKPVWRLELTPTHRQLAHVSLGLDSAPAAGKEIGLLRPKLQFRVPGTEVRIGVQSTVLAFFTPALAGGRRVMRPMGFISGRF